MKHPLVVLALALVTSACGGPAQTPVAPTPPVVIPAPVPEAPPPAPIARLAVTVDGSNVFTVLPYLDTVHIDASGSSGVGLRFGIDYGDGSGVDEATGAHVYGGPAGSYRVRVIVTDALGRTDTAGVNLTATPIDGVWRNSFYNSDADRYESRALRISYAGGRSLRGTYTHPEGGTSDLSGEFGPRRSLTLRLNDGTISFAAPEFGISTISSPLQMQVAVRGGSANGQTLLFNRSGS